MNGSPDTNREGMDPGFRAMLEAEAAAAAEQPRPGPGELPMAVVREGYQLRRTAQDTTPPAAIAVRDLSIALPGRTLAARLYTSQGGQSPSALLVYFHGGGFVIGDLETHDGHCRRLAAGSGAQVLAVDYRLAPEHPFPAAHDDALDAVRWAFDHAGDLGVDRSRIAVGGDSAGGNLAASVACDLADDADHRLAFQLLLYPVTWPDYDTASRRDFDGLILSKAGFAWFDQCLAAASHPDGGRTKVAGRKSPTPGLIVTAGFDPLRDEGRELHEARQVAGTPSDYLECPALIHDFFIMPDVSNAVGTAASAVATRLGTALGTAR